MPSSIIMNININVRSGLKKPRIRIKRDSALPRSPTYTANTVRSRRSGPNPPISAAIITATFQAVTRIQITPYLGIVSEKN